MRKRQQRSKPQNFTKVQRSIKIFTTMIVIIAVVFLTVQVVRFENAKKELTNAEEILSYVETKEENLFEASSSQITLLNQEVNNQDEKLERAGQMISKTQEVSNQYEQSSGTAMRPLYEQAQEELMKADQLLQEIEIDPISESKAEISDDMSLQSKEIKESLSQAKQILDEVVESKTINCDLVSTKYDDLETKLQDGLVQKEKVLNDVNTNLNAMQAQYVSLKEQYAQQNENAKQFLGRIVEYESFEQMKVSLRAKLQSANISYSTDMSKPIGFSEEELKYLLEHCGMIKDPNIINTLPRVMVETVKNKNVNELFAISVMSFESGFFKSALARNKCNYGGMRGQGGWMSFTSMEEGLASAISCVHGNLKGNNTVEDVNSTYCGSSEWSENVLDIMESYRATKI